MSRFAHLNSFCRFGIEFELVHPQADADSLGYVPAFIRTDDDRPAREQINDRYGEHGGWSPMGGWKMRDTSIAYPGDPPLPLVARAKLRDEEIRFYAGAWIAIVQPDGGLEIARVD